MDRRAQKKIRKRATKNFRLMKDFLERAMWIKRGPVVRRGQYRSIRDLHPANAQAEGESKEAERKSPSSIRTSKQRQNDVAMSGLGCKGKLKYHFDIISLLKCNPCF